MSNPTPNPPVRPDSDESEHHTERKVVYETVSSSTTKSSGITIAVIIVIAIVAIAWIVMQMR